MKQTYLSILLFFAVLLSINAQTFNYQAVIRDNSGKPVSNQSMGVLVRILSGSPTGSVLYNEVHTVTSNTQGVISLPVGGGTSGANFLAIDWSTQNHWIDIQVDLAGGTNYLQIGTTKLNFVPYAMYALKSSESNNAGAFGITNNVVSNQNGNNSTNDFVFGSSQLDANGTNSPANNTRMFFDKSKGAFRAGYTPGNQWDEVNVGNYSVAFGESAMAKGQNSFAMGRNTNATGLESFGFGINAGGFADYARGIGPNARANGVNSTAIGRHLNANSMAEIQLGQYSNYVSGSTDTWVETDRLFVIGNGQEDINLALNSDALVMLKNGNTTLNGTLTIDADNKGSGRGFTFPAQDGIANQIMQTDGSGNISWVTPAATAIPNGGTNGYVLATDGAGVFSWITNNDADFDPTNEIELPVQTGESGKFLTTDGTAVSWQNVPNELPNGGTNGQVLSTDGSGIYSWIDQSASPIFTSTSNITSNGNATYGTDDFIFGAPTNVTGSDINAANRIFFDKSKAAIRIGRDIGGVNAFADVNVGAYSAAFGLNPKAAGENAFAAGFLANASGYNAVALGNTTTASGSSSIVIGNNSTASGTHATAIGKNVTAEAYGQTTLGYYNTGEAGNANGIVVTDRLLVVGNGTTDINGINNSDALVMLKNGNTTLNGSLTIDGDNQGSGNSYTLPAQDGTANQIMTTDGSGNVSWSNAAASGAFTTTSNVTSNAAGNIATDDFVFGSTQLNDDTNTTDDDNRMFFDKSKGAFRAGRAWGNQWDDANVERWTIAMGNASLAKGIYSVAIGDRNRANFDTSIALGDRVVTDSPNSYGLGSNVITNSPYQTSLGVYNTEYTPAVAVSFTEPTNRLLVVGNGTGLQRSDALVMLRNGNTTLNGSLTIDGDNQGTGASYTLPAQDGAANQVMTTDGSGNVSWINYGLEAVSSPTFNTGWENYSVAHGSGFEDARYYVDNGRVYLGGLIRKTSGINVGEIMLTLPVGYRPQKQRIFTVSTEAGIVRVDVASNGNVIFNAPAHNGGQNWVSLDGISFRID